MLFDFNRDYQLENRNVLLRPLNISDKPHLLRFSINEPEIWCYSLISAAGEQNLESYIKIAADNRDQEKEYPFIVFDKQRGEYAGSTRFYDIQLQMDTLQLGYTW